METEKIVHYLKRTQSLYQGFSFVSAVVTVGALIVMFWIAGSPQRTVFGATIKGMERKIVAERKVLETPQALPDNAETLRRSAIKFAQLSLTQNVVIRQLIDLGFVGFVFWCGVFMFGLSLNQKLFLRKLERMVRDGTKA